MKTKKCRVEVIDSQTVAGGLGLVVLSAARKAQDGTGMDELLEFTQKALKRSHFLVYFDTLKYLTKGGRIGKAQGFSAPCCPSNRFSILKTARCRRNQGPV